VLLRLLSYLSRAKIRIVYHWSELWRTLLSFFRFLSTYTNDIRSIPRSTEIVDLLVNLLAFALSNGENFLPDPTAYDDLFYKVVETGDILVKFRDAFSVSGQSRTSIQMLINVSSHYHELLAGNEKGKTRTNNLSPREVSDVIKKGYDTLSIEAVEGLDQWDKYREVDFKTFLKRIARVAVDDARSLDMDK